MGLYNTLHDVSLTCPRCGQASAMNVDLYFGYRDLIDYRLGDTCEWRSEQAFVRDGERPPEGNLDGDGYAVCPLCKKDFFVTVLVRNDQLVGAEPDCSKKPYIPD